MPTAPFRLPARFAGARALALPLLALGLVAFFVISARGDLRHAAHTALHADPRWVGLALLCQAAALGTIAANYRRLLGRLGHEVGWRAMLRAHLRRHAVATLVPFGSPASYVVFARDLAGAGVPGGDAMSAILLYSAGGQAAFVLFVAGALTWLTITADLHLNPLAALVAMPIALAWVALPFLALHSGVAKFARWRWVPGPVGRQVERLARHRLTPRDLLAPMLFSLAVNAAGLGMLIASLHAVGQRPSISGLLLARLAGQLAAHAVPVMQGAGVVELSLVGSLQQAGVAATAATAGTLLFRLAQFWLPLALGALLLVNLGRCARAHRRAFGHACSMSARVGGAVGDGAVLVLGRLAPRAGLKTPR